MEAVYPSCARPHLATKLWPLALLFLILLGAVACNGSGDSGASPTAESSPTASSPTPGASPTPVSLSPTPEPSPATLAPGFPEDFPVYAGATLDRSEPVEGAVLARWKTPDPVSQVAEFYKQALAEEPWEILAMDDMPETSLVGIQITRTDIPDVTGAMAIRRVISDEVEVTSIFVSITPLE